MAEPSKPSWLRQGYDPGRSGGFLKLHPWLQSASEERRARLSLVALVAMVLIGAWTVFSLLQAGSQPLLPSSHAVEVQLRGVNGSAASGSGHLVWYKRGKLLVFAVNVSGLPANSAARAYLVPTSSCAGARLSGSRELGRVTSDASGLAEFNEELLGVDTLRFGADSIWVEAGGGRQPRACGVLSLARSGQI
ncbi:MAG: hypothetical protein ACREN4_00080 [Candidatus Dormibacteria bacterium]